MHERSHVLGRRRGGHRSLPRSRVARSGDVVLAEGRLALGAGARTLRLKLGRGVKRSLGRRLKLTLRVTATDAAGNRRVVTRRLQVR